eukprot:556878-Rhodomonas_salina.4
MSSKSEAYCILLLLCILRCIGAHFPPLGPIGKPSNTYELSDVILRTFVLSKQTRVVRRNDLGCAHGCWAALPEWVSIAPTLQVGLANRNVPTRELASVLRYAYPGSRQRRKQCNFDLANRNVSSRRDGRHTQI